MNEELKKQFAMFVPEDDGSAMDWFETTITEIYAQGYNDGANQQYNELKGRLPDRPINSERD